MDRTKYLELLEPALKLVVAKGEDYNQKVQLHDYFPFNDYSYQQMLHMKVLRMRSVLHKGSKPNYDSVLDSLYDLINYSIFYAEYLTLKSAPPKVVAPTGIVALPNLNKPFRTDI